MMRNYLQNKKVQIGLQLALKEFFEQVEVNPNKLSYTIRSGCNSEYITRGIMIGFNDLRSDHRGVCGKDQLGYYFRITINSVCPKDIMNILKDSLID
jgi:hypothetical protein